MPDSDFDPSNIMQLICPICHMYMYKVNKLDCDHMFCEVCLNEYTLYLDSCPVCDKKIGKNWKIAKCRIFDDAIEKLLKYGNILDEKEFEQWQ